MRFNHLRIAALLTAILFPFLALSCKKEEKGGGSETAGGGKVTAIALNKTSLELSKNGSFQLQAVLTPQAPSNPTVVWTSSDTDVVEVSNGLVTAKSDGKATITARPVEAIMEGNFSLAATCSVVVETIVVREINFPDDVFNISLTSGTYQLKPEIVPEAANKPGVLSYTVTSGNDVLTVSSTGLVTLKAIGTATITVSANDDAGANRDLIFHVQEADVWPTSITYDFKEDMVVGEKQRVRIVYEPATANRKNLPAEYLMTGDGKSLKATKISDEEIELEALKATDGTINEDLGIQFIVSFQKGYVSGSTAPNYDVGPHSSVFIHNNPPSLSIDENQPTAWGKLSDGMVVGETHELQVQLENMHSNTLEYEVGSPEVLSVDADGRITALSKGLSSIHVQTPDHKSGQTLRIQVYGVPKTITADCSELFVRYGSYKSVKYTIKDKEDKNSRQAVAVSNESSLPYSMGTTVYNYASGTAQVDCQSSRTSANSTIKGKLVVTALDYPSVKASIDVYDAMYDELDIKPFDGIVMKQNTGLYFVDGGFRGSGYFEEVSSATRDKFEECRALVIWTGSRSSLALSSSRLSLSGKNRGSRPKVNGFAVATTNAATGTHWQEKETSVNGTQYYVGASLWGGGTPISTYDNHQYGYEITTAMKNYNNNRSGDYAILPVKALSKYGDVPTSYGTSGWYVPTSSEWYMMFSAMGSGTTKANAIMISERIKNWTEGGEPLLDLSTEQDTYKFWSCQEGEDTVHPGEALNNVAVYMQATQATPAGSMPDRRIVKQSLTANTRGFLAF